MKALSIFSWLVFSALPAAAAGPAEGIATAREGAELRTEGPELVEIEGFAGADGEIPCSRSSYSNSWHYKFHSADGWFLVNACGQNFLNTSKHTPYGKAGEPEKLLPASFAAPAEVLKKMAADGGFQKAVLVIVKLGLNDKLRRFFCVSLSVCVKGFFEIDLDIFKSLLPDRRNTPTARLTLCTWHLMFRLVCGFRYQFDPAFQFGSYGLQLSHKIIYPFFHCGHRLFARNHLADSDELLLEFVTFLCRDIDADRAFQVLKDLEIGRLGLQFRLLDVPLFVKAEGFIKKVPDFSDHPLVIESLFGMYRRD